MGQGIHTGGGGDFPGQLFDHHRVQDHVVRDHLGVDDAHFQLLLRHGHNGVGGGLGTGAGGGGNHQGLHTLPGPPRGVQQLFNAVLVGHQNAGELGGVHDAAAAHSHNEVRAALLALVHQLLRLHVAGLRRQIVQDHGLHAGLLNLGHGKFQQARPLDALVGEHHQALDAVGGENLRNPAQGILAAVHRMGHLQFVLGQHLTSSS